MCSQQSPSASDIAVQAVRNGGFNNIDWKHAAFVGGDTEALMRFGLGGASTAFRVSKGLSKASFVLSKAITGTMIYRSMESANHNFCNGKYASGALDIVMAAAFSYNSFTGNVNRIQVARQASLAAAGKSSLSKR